MITKFIRGIKIAAIILFLLFCLAFLNIEIVSPQTFSILGIVIFVTTAYCEVLLGV